MTCEEVTILIKAANEGNSQQIKADLREYITGERKVMEKQLLLTRLQNWKDRNSCNLWPNEAICIVIDRAIANLQ